MQIANDSGNACDITDATVSLTLPAADGSPSGQTVTLAAGVDYPAGTGRRVIGRVPWVVNLNPGVSNAIAQGNADGTLHDAPARAGGIVDARGERHGLARRRAVRGRQGQRDGGVRDVAGVAGVVGDLHRVGARVAVADRGPVLGERQIERVGVASRRRLVRHRGRYRDQREDDGGYR